MKQLYITRLFLLLSVSASLYADNCTNAVTTHISPRSQSVNQSRIMSGCVDHINRFDMDTINGSFFATAGYSQSFRSDDIAQCLFGKSLQGCDCPTIGISGSRVSNRNSCDLLADYFGLPTDYQSTITFKPKIQNFFIDLALHVGLDQWVNGMWFKVWAPFVHARWDLDWCESSTSNGSANHDPGYFNGSDGVPRANLLNNAKEFFQERKSPNLGSALNSSVTFEALKSCRWGDCGCDGDLTENGLADLRFAFGWNFFQDEDYHIGLGLIAAAPTGNRPEGCFLFEPMIGNGNHWEFGGLWTSHAIFWRSKDESKHFGGYLDANITHMFKTHQKRCFDLCGKPLSRYMLAEKLGTPVENLFGNPAETRGTINNAQAPSAQFKNAFAPVANLTCSDVDVSVGVQADVVAMLNYTSGGFSLDLGYNLWARSCEKIEFDCECLPRLAKEKDTWALKGDAFVYGFSGTNGNSVRALSGTQSNATIYKGTNNFVGPDVDTTTNPSAGIQIGTLQVGPTQNPGVDNRNWAQATNVVDDPIRNNPSSSLNIAKEHTNTSLEPIFINLSDINFDGSGTKALSHSVFTHFSYSWLNNDTWTPFLGIGAQAEFSNNSDGDCSCSSCSNSSNANSNSTTCSTSCTSNCDTASCNSSCNSCDSCQRCSISQWSVWIKGGITFN